MSSVRIFDRTNFDQEVLHSALPVLVNFTMSDSIACEAIEPYVEEIALEFHGRLVVGQVDTDHDRDLIFRYDVQDVPTLIVFHGGQPVDALVGFPNPNRIRELVERHATST